MEAADFHPKSNLMKLSSGIPLTEDDHWVWLASITEYVLNSHRNTFILVCNPIEEIFQNYLAQRLEIQWVILKMERKKASKQMSTTGNQRVKQKLIDAQFKALEIPANAIQVNADEPFETMLKKLLNHF